MAEKKPEKVYCRMLGVSKLPGELIGPFCRFYVGQKIKATLGNQVCHEECGVPVAYGLKEPV